MYIRVIPKHWGCRLGENTSKKEMEERAGGEVTNRGMVLQHVRTFRQQMCTKNGRKNVVTTCHMREAAGKVTPYHFNEAVQ